MNRRMFLKFVSFAPLALLINKVCVINKKDHSAWYRQGKFHRKDGPAVEYRASGKDYWVNCSTTN